MPSITTTAVGLSGGADAVAGQGTDTQVTVAGTWATGDKYTLVMTDNDTAVQTQVGAGYASGVVPNFAFTFNNKVYTLSGATVYFSAVADPTTWNDPNAIFNGYVTMSNYYGTQDNLVAIATYQGRLAFFSNYTIQFWIIDPNPVNWQQAQVLTNIGTYAPLSVASVGDLDVMFLNYTGVRSLRVRDSSLNAFVNDIGSPIDTFVQEDIAQAGITATAASCSIVDPSTGRYWLFIPNPSAANGVGSIYVLSHYPSNKIIAWSTYDPSYINTSNNTVYFTPVKFIIYNGQVSCLASDGNVYTFGGATNDYYDSVTATVQIPFFDMKRPAHNKLAGAIDVDIADGTWNIYATSDWINGTLTQTNTATQATYDQGWIPFSSQGTHFSVEATTASPAMGAGNLPVRLTAPPSLASMVLHYSLGEEPVQ